MKNIKKILSIILVLVVSVTMLGMFCACGELDELKNLVDDQFDDFDDDEDDDDAVIEFTTEDIKSNMPATYRITYRFTSTSEEESTSYDMTMTKASNGYMFDNSGNSSMFVACAGGYNCYTRTVEDSSWELSTTLEDEPYVYTGEDLDAYTGTYATFMTLYVGYEEDLKLGEMKNICGRACTEYYYEASYGGSSYSLHYYVDNAIHCCMQYTITGVVAGEGSGSATWEVTEFTTTNVTLPAVD
ncbi:MAG: hypothetical protein PHE93_05275 [Clostridia bacterium]|nr:hypothetical protein [Clostridia bacterium]